MLKDHYVTIRQDLVGAGREDSDPDAPPPAIPITVRQLEALARIAESLARMEGAEEATVAHVDEATLAFRGSATPQYRRNLAQD